MTQKMKWNGVNEEKAQCQKADKVNVMYRSC